MSGRAGAASAEQTTESHSEGNETGRLQQSLQPTESCNSKEPRGWITEAEWTLDIQDDSGYDRQRLRSVVSIFRVPKFLEGSKREFYVPQRVSLGPYHHRSAELHPMNRHKGRAVSLMRRVLSVMGTTAEDRDNMDFCDAAREEIAKLENEIRYIYEEKIDCDGRTLATMLTLDGCFILGILSTLALTFLFKRNRTRNDPIFEYYRIALAGSDILDDIIMLENQIPLVVLEKLLQLALPEHDVIHDELLPMVRTICERYFPADYSESSWPQVPVHHLLGVMHNLVVHSPFPLNEIGHTRCRWIKCIKGRLRSTWSECCTLINYINKWSKCIKWCSADTTENSIHRVRRAIELRNAGIEFKRCGGGISKIKYDPKNATIFLPPIAIVDHTEVFFRNLLAFEMCRPYESENYVTSYASLMDELIGSEDDVALLRRREIITNYLGSDAEVAQLFNRLFDKVTKIGEADVFQDLKGGKAEVFRDLKGAVYLHYKNKMKVHCALLRREHFSSPWKAIGLVGAFLIVFLTTVQTIYSVLSFYK